MVKGTGSRELVLDILLEILEQGSYSHLVLRQALSKHQYLEKQERAFVSRIVEGTIEYLIPIDTILDSSSKVPVHKMKPVIRTILRMSVYQMMYMDRVPDSAVCNEAVKLAQKRKLQGLKGYVNGVLRTIARQKETYVFTDWENRYSMPDWLIELWKESYPSHVVEGMLRFFLSERPLSVRCNTDRASKDEIIKSLSEQAVTVTVSELSDHVLYLSDYDYPESLNAFRRGWIQIQDVSSSLVGDVADPGPGAFILDVCGAPGGKSLHLADKLGGSGMVEVRDLTENKIALVEDNIARTGCRNIRTKVWDACVLDESMIGQADIVIADLPCSGLGIIGKKPDIKYRVTKDGMAALAALQREILSVVWQYVKPGGRLIYSTCTVNPRENEEQVKWLTDHFPFESVSIEDKLGENLPAKTLKDGFIQLVPGIHPCDGFFIAAFERK